MNVPDIEHFEAQAAETVGAMKALFREFEARLGEVVSAQRLASSESRDEASKARAALEELVRQAKAIVEAQRQALTEVRQGWRLHVAENTRAAGEEIARAFGAQIASGLREKLETMTIAVEGVTRRFAWTTALKWIAGIAVAIPMTVALGLWAFLPRVEGLPWQYVRAGASKLRACEVGQEMHVCIVTVDKAQVLTSARGEPVVVVRGM